MHISQHKLVRLVFNGHGKIEKSEKHPVKERIDAGSVCDLCDTGPEHKNELINSRHKSQIWDPK